MNSFIFANPGYVGLLGSSTPINSDWLLVKAAIEGTGITLNSTQNTAGNRYILDLQGYANPNYSTTNIWSKIVALHAYLGGTANAHKFNWKNPVDSDAAFRLVYPNGSTHSATGMKFNGTNQYANSFAVPSLISAGGSGIEIFCYIRDTAPTPGDVTDMGILTTGTSAFFISSRNSAPGIGDNPFARAFSVDQFTPTTNGTKGLGLFGIGRFPSTTSARISQNGLAISMSGTQGGTIPTEAITYGALRIPGSFYGYTTRETALNIILNTTLTTAELLMFYTATQAYQTALGRAVS